MTAPKAQSARKEKYCFITCLAVKSLSSNVHTLLKIKFEVMEIIMPNIVAWMYQMFGTTFATSNDTK